MNKKDIGQQLKFYRKKAGYTQAELAELIDIHEKQISRIESGIHFPTFNNFIKIMNILKIEMSDFKSTENNKYSKENIAKTLHHIIDKSNEKDLKLYLTLIKEIIAYQKNGL